MTFSKYVLHKCGLTNEFINTNNPEISRIKNFMTSSNIEKIKGIRG